MVSRKQTYRRNRIAISRPISITDCSHSVGTMYRQTGKHDNPGLFEAFPTPQDLAAATPEEVYTYIKSVSYPNNKSKHLVGMARTLIEQFNGVVPSEIEDLQKLPGVGRKTANVIASVVFNKEAMAVDTHVFRVSNRIGLTNHSKLPSKQKKHW